MSTRQQVAEAFVDGVSAKCHNSKTDGHEYFLHGSRIAHKIVGGFEFDWHGFYTVTTAAHMNEILRAFGADVRVSYASARDHKHTTFQVQA